MFSNHLVILREIRGEPKVCFDINDLRRTNEIITRVYEGTGPNLALFLLGLKNSEDVRDRTNYKRIREMFKELTGFDFDVSCSFNENQEGMIKGRVMIWIQSEHRQFLIDYVGSGILEILNILCTVIGNRNCIIVLDEPAAHLHPSKQLDLLNKIKSEAKKGENQLIIITHSPYFISSDNIKNVIRFQIEDGQTKIYKPQKLGDPKLLEILEDSNLKSALFSDGVILAEGLSEAFSIPNFLRKLGFNLGDRNINVVSVGGEQGFRRYIEILNGFSIPLDHCMR